MMVPASVFGVEPQPSHYDVGSLNPGLRLGTIMYLPGDYRSDLLEAESLFWYGGSLGFATGTVVRFYHDFELSSLSSKFHRRDQLPALELGPGRLGLDIGLGSSRTSIPLSEIVQAKDLVERFSGMVSDLAEFGFNTVTTSIGFVYRLQVRPEQ